MQSSPKTSVQDLPLRADVRVLVANPDGLIALDKPTGVLSHPNRADDRPRAMLDADYDYDAEVFQWQSGAVTHRAWLINLLVAFEYPTGCHGLVSFESLTGYC